MSGPGADAGRLEDSGQSVTSSVVLGDLVQIQHVAGKVSVRLARPAYRVEEFPAAQSTLPVQQARAQPSRLLLVRYELVPFAGRLGIIGELAGWLAAQEDSSVRLVFGPGGQGKSRLAAQFVRHHAAAWAVWQARQAAPTTQGAAQLTVPANAPGLLVVVDYADRWPPSHLQALVSDLRAAASRLPGRQQLRVLLLARAAGFWWDALEQRLDADYALPAAAVRLTPLGAEADRPGLFTSAFDHFANALGASPSGAASGLPQGLAGPEFGLALTVHMAALAAVDAGLHGEVVPQDPARISAYLLKRERAHWQQWHARAEDPLSTTPVVMGHTVYAATLAGPQSRAQAVALLARAQIAVAPEAATQILDDHGRCYPPEDPATMLEPLYPDRLGEDFLALTTPSQRAAADLAGFADAWAADVLPPLLALFPAGEDPPVWLGTAVTVLIETARRWPHIRDSQLEPLMRDRPRLILQAGGAALTALASLPGLDPALLETIEAKLPPHRYTDLDAGIASLTARLAEHQLAASSDPVEHAQIHSKLGVRLHFAGLRLQALAATEAATGLWRQLTSVEPDAYMADLAGSLTNQALLLAETGRRAGAVTVSEEAIGLYQQLVALDRDAYLPDLATALNNHALWLAETGHRAEAVPVSGEALGLYQQLAALDRDAYLPDLAMALNNHATRLGETGRRAEAVELSEEAVGLKRELVTVNRDAHLPDLAGSLISHAAQLAQVGRRAEAVAVSEEAVSLNRQLATLNRDAYLPNLAMALTNQALVLAEAGRRAEAVVVSEEAVSMKRELAAVNHDAYLPELAISLKNHANRLAEAGRRAEAVTVSEEAVSLYRQLAALNRDAYLPNLAGSLTNHGLWLAHAGRRAEAVPFAEEAVVLYRQLTARNRDAYLPNLAGSLHNHAVALAETGSRAEAVPFSEEAVSLKRELAALNRDAYLPNLAMSLNDHSNRLAETARRGEAVPFSEEAVSLYRQLATLNRDAYLPDLAMSLANYALRLAETGRGAEAIRVSEEAVSLYQQLAALNRDAYLRGYVQAKTVLGYGLIEDAQSCEAVAPLIEALEFGQQLPEYERGVVMAAAQLLQRAYAAEPAAVAEKFRTLARQDPPSWMTKRPSPTA